MIPRPCGRLDYLQKVFVIELFAFTKKSNKTAVGNYRPVSILSVVSEQIESYL